MAVRASHPGIQLGDNSAKGSRLSTGVHKLGGDTLDAGTKWWPGWLSEEWGELLPLRVVVSHWLFLGCSSVGEVEAWIRGGHFGWRGHFGVCLLESMGRTARPTQTSLAI